MMKTTKPWKSWIIKLCLFLIVLLMLPTTALARGYSVEATVNEGEVVDHSLVLSGTEVVMDGVVNGDLLAIGETVKVNGEVNGNLIAISKNVVLNGPVSGSFYVSAINLVIGPEASIGRDVYFIGASLETQTKSMVNRDLNLISLESALGGEVSRNVNALVGPVKLLQSLYQFMVSQGWLPESTRSGTGFIPSRLDQQMPLLVAFGLPSIQSVDLYSSVPPDGNALNITSNTETDNQESTIDVPRLQAWATPVLRNLVALLILGLLIVWLVPAQLIFVGEQVRKSPWRSLFTGLLVFVIGWILVILLAALILVLAIFLYWVSLPNLGFLVGTLGLGSMGVAVSIFWLSIMYFSKIVVAALVGKLLFKRFLPKYAHTRIWPFLVGVIIYVILASIPYLGWLVVVIATLSGLGAIWAVATSRKPQVSEEPASLEPPVESQELSLASEE